ncbi:hypothetical protein RIF29_13990 [Crotalaria pallida]|uniref:Uncharacterized protein n=1 Tax=Crotalaria pallida TaxID=3830 RepID=A0AAN9FCM0_CROPI
MPRVAVQLDSAAEQRKEEAEAPETETVSSLSCVCFSLFISFQRQSLQLAAPSFFLFLFLYVCRLCFFFFTYTKKVAPLLLWSVVCNFNCIFGLRKRFQLWTMEKAAAVNRSNSKKRKLILSDGEDDDVGKGRRFKILLPNGTSVGLTTWDPEPEIPFADFISLVKGKYLKAQKDLDSAKKEKEINWKSGGLYLEDADDVKIRDVVKLKKYKPHKCHILSLRDGSSAVAESFKSMWDLTPDTDLLLELPEDYNFENALADLIDNSLQAVWSNGENDRKLIIVNVANDKIIIFDNGPGMDDSDENSLAKWGKMGASLHRLSRSEAIGGKPPYLKPYFGMFGFGGPIAAMHLGRLIKVSSKTRKVKKVYTLVLDREALLSHSNSKCTWKAEGGIRDPCKVEIRNSNHGSFTKVLIQGLKVKDVDIFRLRCHLKDTYFPYIQSDDMFDNGKTITPVEFKVNGTCLTEIQGGEVAITNLLSCNGPQFVLQLHLLSAPKNDGIRSPSSSRAIQEANARLRCVYFPYKEGKENFEKVLEELIAGGYETSENFQSFSRVSVRRLGRLLPRARWTLLPFMDFRNRKGNKAQLLKRCCLRVKCFIETDAGFKPTPSKTDLASNNPFTMALKNFGSKTQNEEKDIEVKILKDGKVLNPLQLEREYQDWILQMHDSYDEEVDSGEDQPVMIVSPANKKALGISSDVIRVHQLLKRKEKSWKAGQKVKVLKGACAGVYKNNIYATLEYFLLEGLEGDAGGDARIICRPIDIPDENGSVLSVGDKNKNASLVIRGSLSLPLSVIDSGKLVAVASTEWDNHLKRKQLKSPATVDLLSSDHCQQLEIDGTLPINNPVFAGQVPPSKVVAVIRPVNFMPGAATGKLDQKDICKNNIDMVMEVKLKNQGLNDENIIHIERASPESYKGFNGLYFFPLGCKLPDFFTRTGTYIFSFSLTDSSCNSIKKSVIVKPSPDVGSWKILNHDQSSLPVLRVGSYIPTLTVACYDKHGNRAPFQNISGLTVKLQTEKGLLFETNKPSITFSSNKLALNIKDILVKIRELDKIRPGYEATLVIASSNKLLSLPCKVYPGHLKKVELQPAITESHLLPGHVFEKLTLEMFDAYGNHVFKELEVTLSLDGFNILDHVAMIHKVDDKGRIDLSGLLKVTAGYGRTASISVLYEDRTIFKQEFSTVKRNLRITSGVPDFCTVGGQLENIIFEVVDDVGDVDTTIHHDDKDGQIHMLTIKSDSFNADESIRYTFQHGCCTIPSIPIPLNEGTFCFEAAHSRHRELHLIVKVPVVKPRTIINEACQHSSPDNIIMHEHDSPLCNQQNNLLVNNAEQAQVPVVKSWTVMNEACQHASPDNIMMDDQGLPSFNQQKNLAVNNAEQALVPDVESPNMQYAACRPSPLNTIIPEQDSPAFNQKLKLMLSLVSNDMKEMEDSICTIGEVIAEAEKNIDDMNTQKNEIEQEMEKMLENVKPYKNCILTKDELKLKIESMGNTAAAVLCSLSAYQERPKCFTEEIVGLVALLGTVKSPDLSRILAEYLGEDKMLAVICKSFDAASSIESYKQSGAVDFERGLHAEAATLGRAIHNRFLVICLEDISPYTGGQGNDPQRKLALPDPKLKDGKTPDGFLGYAVNMVDLDTNHLNISTASGHGLRETVLFSLFKKLQVFETRESMLAARACIQEGAVSLDGGILRENGLLSLGVGDPCIYFPCENQIVLPPELQKITTRIEKKQLELKSCKEEIRKLTKYRKKCLKKFKIKEGQYYDLLNRIERETMI